MENMKKVFTKNNIVSALGCIVFLVIAFCMFLKLTYLFRNVDSDRIRVLGIKSEKNIDVVYVGGSATTLYWQPIEAWKEYGITSYDYSTNSIQAESIEAYVREVKKYQNPELFVVDARAFQYYTNEMPEIGFRRGTDSFDFTSLNRYRLLKDVFVNRDISENTDITSLFVDISKYHANLNNLKNKEAWVFSNNRATARFKGGELKSEYAYFEDCSEFVVSERKPLLPKSIEVLRSFCEYCKKENLHVLFVLCPHVIYDADVSAQYNTIGDIVTSYGFDWLNVNEHYEEASVDFSLDFSDINHVNAVGASKYTKYLGSFIQEKYRLKDHRDEPDFADWFTECDEYETAYLNAEALILNYREYILESPNILENLKNTNSLQEFYQIATSKRFVLLIEVPKNYSPVLKEEDASVMRNWTIDPDCLSGQLRAINNGVLWNTNSESENDCIEGAVGIFGLNKYVLDTSAEVKAFIDDEPIEVKQNCVNIIVYENDYRKFICTVNISWDNNGDAILTFSER